MKSIKINNLSINIDNNLILKDINLDINQNETILVLGPNGHGKSTLFKSIFKHYSTQIVNGTILFDNININDLSVDEIIKKGCYYSFQSPIEIPGLKTFELLRIEFNNKYPEKNNILDMYKILNNGLKKLNLDQSILQRNINENFSGGEKKKIEILQLMLLDSNFIFLDEIDSGLDTDAVNIIGEILLEFKKQGKTIVFISHNEKLVQILQPEKVLVMYNGEIIKIGDINLANEINKFGYTKIIKDLNLNNLKVNHNDDLKSTNVDFYCKNEK